jgi:PAS domain S-box-containing protein
MESPDRKATSFLSGGGPAGALMRRLDWSRSPLGPPETWPQSLRSVVGLVLGSKFPMFVAWGLELGFLYNDAYGEILGAKHPAAMGARFRDIWAEIWADISPLIDAAMAGEATYRQDLPLLMNRKGFDEETWFTFSYSPVRDESGEVAGMFCAVQETTDRVLAARRQADEAGRQRRMFRQAPGFICTLTGPDHVFEFANETYLRLFGPRDIVGLPARGAFPDLAGQGFFELLDQVYTSGERHVAHAAPVRLRGQPEGPEEERFLDFIYEPLTDEGGRVVGIFCEGHDVTEAHRAQQALAAGESRLRLALEAGRMAVFEHDPVTRSVRSSPELNAMLGYSPDAELDVMDAATRYAPGDWDRMVGAALEALQTGGRFFETEFRFQRASDGALRWFLLRGEIVLTPDGAPPRTIGVLLDVTDRKQVEEDLDAALAAGNLAIFDFDHAALTFRPSPRLNEIYGYPPDHRLTIDDVRDRYHPEDMDQILERSRRDDADPSMRHFDWAFRLKWEDRPVCWVEGRGEYVRDEDGRILRSRGVVMDITERKLWEERQRLLMNELNHRVKNTLAVVQGLAHQTFRGGASIEDARPIFEARLAALSATHDLLTRRSWEAAPLRQIVEASVLGTAGANAARVRIAGPDVSLAPQAAVSFALAVHELSTNAVKYGALSNDTGEVAVSWQVEAAPEGRRLSFHWQERGGPQVAEPGRRGFGSRMIQDALARELGGEVVLDFPPEGLVCMIQAPLRG